VSVHGPFPPPIAISTARFAVASSRGRRGSRRPTTPRPPDGADAGAPADPDDPLVVMSTASQLTIGLLMAALLASAWSSAESARELATAAGLTLVFGLAATLRYVGRPRHAIRRASVGGRTSWLDRGIVAFGAGAALAGAYLASTWMDGPGARESIVFGSAAVAVGLAGIVCSAMVLHASGYRPWRFASSGSQFLGTTVSFGAAALALAASSSAPALARAAAAVVGCTTTLKLAGLAALLYRRDRLSLPVACTVRRLRGRLRTFTALRTVAGALVLPFAAAVAAGHPPAALLVVGCSIVGETTERLLFFRAIGPARWPATS
jgi:hypothetical protein